MVFLYENGDYDVFDIIDMDTADKGIKNADRIITSIRKYFEMIS